MLDENTLGIVLLRAALHQRIRLEYDVNLDKKDLQAAFTAKYHGLTGDKARIGQDGYTSQTKRSDQCRIYLSLNGPERNYCRKTGIKLTRNDHYQSDKYNYRSSNRQLFWDLVEAGFRLGEN